MLVFRSLHAYDNYEYATMTPMVIVLGAIAGSISGCHRNANGGNTMGLSRMMTLAVNGSRINEQILTASHRGADDYMLIVPAELLAEQQRTKRIFDIVMVALASISLLVGGIGIMNIMLASVLERTREIGVRRAIGARRSDIIRQFVMETTWIAVAGGTMGLLLGASMSRLIANFAGWSTIISSGSLALAFSVSVLIGLVSGVYPAMKAARLDPVQALHYE